ncbi:MAG: putative transporter ATP-binding protein [Solirubrobacterales bacterium]|nr:putative transporter ATP-binding protein [Solirubrobacterales bacterium]
MSAMGTDVVVTTEGRTDAGTTAAATGLSAVRVAMDIEGQRILHPMSIDVAVGELVGMIGPSGSGKSTLLRVLAGVWTPSEGGVVIGEHWVQSRSTEVGYVPFGTLLHEQLTVREALLYAGRLRLPRVAADEVHARVEEVIAELHMGASADVRVGALSDGQKRRAACGAELVGRPPVLLLDEPTTGLDVALERRMMRMLRRLADDGRGVLVTTHTTASLDLCDRVAVMAPGGVLGFVGTPDEVREHFGVTEIADVYDVLGDEPSPPAPALDDATPVDGSWAALPPLPALGAQTAALAGRYARCLLREQRSLTLLIGQAPVIGFAIGAVLPKNALASSTLGPYYTMLLAFLLLTGTLWLGLISACREIVKERGIIEREFAVGVRIDAYIVAKCAVLFPLAAAQVLLLVLPALILQPLPTDGVAVLQVLAICMCCAWAAVGVGLWVSAAVHHADHATGSVPLLLIPQLLLAGALIPFDTLVAPLKLIGDLMISRWALTGLGSVLGLAQTTGSNVGSLIGSDPGFYRAGAGAAAAAMVVLTVVTLIAAGITLARRVTR